MLVFRTGFPLFPLIRPVECGPCSSSRIVSVVAVVIAAPLADVRRFLVTCVPSLSFVSSLTVAFAFASTRGTGSILTSSSSSELDDEELEELDARSFLFKSATFLDFLGAGSESGFVFAVGSVFESESEELLLELESELELLDFLETVFVALGAFFIFTTVLLPDPDPEEPEDEPELELLFSLTSAFLPFVFCFTSASLSSESDSELELESDVSTEDSVLLESRSVLGFPSALVSALVFTNFFFCGFALVEAWSLDSSSN